MLTLELKKKKVGEIEGLVEKYPVIGLVDMTLMPAKQLQILKKNLQGKAIIKLTRKKLIERAFNSSKKAGIKKLLDLKVAQPALIFSNDNSFKLFRILDQGKSPAPAKANAVATKDIVVEKGATDFPPGPMISEFNKLGLKTKVEQGKIAIQETKVVVKEGDVIQKEIAEVLNKLGMEPLEIGLNLKATFEDDVLFTKEVLDVDPNAYMNQISLAARSAFNLTVNIGWPTKQNIKALLGESFRKAKSLVLEAGLPEKKFIEEIIGNANRKVKSLESELGDWKSKVPQPEIKGEVEEEKVENDLKPEKEEPQEAKDENSKEIKE